MGIDENANQLLEQYKTQSKGLEQQIDKTTNDITTTLLYRNKLIRASKACKNGKNYGVLGTIGFGVILGITLITTNWVGAAISAAGLAINGVVTIVAAQKEKNTKQAIQKAGKVVSELEKHTKSLESEKEFFNSKIKDIQNLVVQNGQELNSQLEDIKNQTGPEVQQLKQDVVDFVEKAQAEYYGKDDEGREV